MKKLFTLGAAAIGALTLTGCEVDNQKLEDIISKCKEDVECKEIIDREIDQALEERGIHGDEFYEDFYFDEDFDWEDDFYYEELTDEEIAMLEVLENLDDEFFTVIDNMTDEEVEALMIAELEAVLGRTITEEEIAAYHLIETIFTEIEDKYTDEWFEDLYEQEFETDQEYFEFYLGRSLTEQELADIELVESLWEQTYDFDEDDYEDYDDEDYHDYDDFMYEDMTEAEYLAMLLDRELTEAELQAITNVEAIYNELDDTFFEIEMETMLQRELTEEEKEAFDLIDQLEEEIYSNMDYDFDLELMITEYETVLERELTEEEVNALNYFYDYEVEEE